MRTLVLVLVAALGITGVVARLVGGPLFNEGTGPARSAWTDDFLQDYVSARAWRDGTDPYAQTTILRDRYVGRSINDGTPPGQVNPHPPAAFLVVVPLTSLSYDVARALWLVLSALAIAVALAALARALGTARITAVAIGIGALALPVVQKDLSFGQNNGPILLLIVGAWLALRARRPVLAGLLLGAAVAVKLYPIFLLIALIRLGARRAAVVMVGSFVAISCASALLVGATAVRVFITDASPGNFEYWRAGPMNLSLVALPFRWLTDNPWRDASIHLPTGGAVLALLAVALCLIAAWRTGARTTGDVYWSAVPWMILATPLAWEHYLVLALPAAGLALTRALRDDATPLVLIALAAAAVVIGTPPGVSTTVPGISDLVQVLAYGLPMYGLLLLGIMDLRRAARREDAVVGAASVR